MFGAAFSITTNEFLERLNVRAPVKPSNTVFQLVNFKRKPIRETLICAVITQITQARGLTNAHLTHEIDLIEPIFLVEQV